MKAVARRNLRNALRDVYVRAGEEVTYELQEDGWVVITVEELVDGCLFEGKLSMDKKDFERDFRVEPEAQEEGIPEPTLTVREMAQLMSSATTMHIYAGGDMKDVINEDCTLVGTIWASDVLGHIDAEVLEAKVVSVYPSAKDELDVEIIMPEA